MPFSGGSLRSGYKYKKKRYTRYKGYNMTPAKVSKIVNKIEDKNTEFKYNETDNQVVACDTSGFVQLLNGMAYGTRSYEHVGKTALMRSVQIQGALFTNISGIEDNWCRIMLLQDSQTNGTQIKWYPDYLQTQSVFTFRSRDYKKRFRCLYDSFVHLESAIDKAGGGLGTGNCKMFKIYKRFKFPVEFNEGTAGTVGDISKGALWLIFLGSNTPGISAASGRFSWRCRFTDV